MRNLERARFYGPIGGTMLIVGSVVAVIGYFAVIMHLGSEFLTPLQRLLVVLGHGLALVFVGFRIVQWAQNQE